MNYCFTQTIISKLKNHPQGFLGRSKYSWSVMVVKNLQNGNLASYSQTHGMKVSLFGEMSRLNSKNVTWLNKFLGDNALILSVSDNLGEISGIFRIIKNLEKLVHTRLQFLSS